MNEEVKQSMTTTTWIRGLYMLLFAFIYSLAEAVVVFICIFQFIVKLARGEISHRWLALSQQVCDFMLQILHYETFKTDVKPFPYSDWPGNNTTNENGSNEPIKEATDGNEDQVEDAIEGEVVSASDQEEEK